jgi:hypothetical protein
VRAIVKAASLIFIAASITASVASAHSPVARVYTQVDDARANRYGLCKTISVRGLEEEPVVEQRCPRGPNGWPVTMLSADARTTVWFGRQVAGANASEALGGAFADPHGVIEWRLLDGRPFAAIQRYYLNDRQVLTVHRLQPDGTSCVAAVVPVRPGHDANAEAAEIADAIGPAFRCGRDNLAVIGNL